MKKSLRSSPRQSKQPFRTLLEKPIERRWLYLLSGCLLLAGISAHHLKAAFERFDSQSTSQLRPRLSALPQDPYIQAYFNQSQSNVYTDSYRDISRYGDNLEQIVITAIDEATTSIDVAVQEFNLPLIAHALVRSAQRGVKVRVVLENQYSDVAATDRTRDYSALPNTALTVLRDAAIPIIDDTADGSKGSGLMHHKFVVIDNRQVLAGSANFTYSGIHGDRDDSGSRGNANALLKIESSAIAAQFATEFNQMWGDGPGNNFDSKFGIQKDRLPAQQTVMPKGGTLTLQFSPSAASQPWQASTNGLIADVLGQAQTSIDMALFVFSEQRIANQLQVQAAKSVEIRALIDSSFLSRSYSEALDMLGTAIPDSQCRLEEGNEVWQSPISTVGIPELPAGDKLHHKFALIDNRTVVIGSHNWSHAANTKNDEALLIIENPTVAAHFVREFDRLYEKAALGITPRLRNKIERAKQRCNTSTSSNNYKSSKLFS